jgi:hypothetical protein
MNLSPASRAWKDSTDVLDLLEHVNRVREQIMQGTNGKLFEDSTEIIRQQREERTRQLMGGDEE